MATEVKLTPTPAPSTPVVPRVPVNETDVYWTNALSSVDKVKSPRDVQAELSIFIKKELAAGYKITVFSLYRDGTDFAAWFYRTAV